MRVARMRHVDLKQKEELRENNLTQRTFVSPLAEICASHRKYGAEDATLSQQRQFRE